MVCLISVNGCTFLISRALHKVHNYDFTVVSREDLDYTIIPIEIEIKTDGISGIPLLPITLKGKEILLDLDSAAFAPIHLNPEIVQMLDLEYTGKSITIYDIKGNRFKTKEFIVPELHLGDFKLLNVIGYEDWTPKDRLFANENGLIGSGILRRFKLIVDYPESRIVLVKEGGTPPKDYQVSNWIRLPQITTWEAELDDTRYRLKLGWDTCASFSIIKPRREFVRKKDERRIVKFSNLRINNHDFGPIEFAICDFNLPIDGCLGYNFFKTHKVYFDFENDIVAIKKD
jgi:hypothetical protein